MPEVIPLPVESVKAVAVLARTFLVAARNWSLYPPEHPAVAASLERWRGAVNEAAGEAGIRLGVAPDTLLLGGVALRGGDQTIPEAAALLHRRNLLEVTFAPGVPLAALKALLGVLTLDLDELRERGGPATLWTDFGHPSIALKQIDYHQVLEDRQVQRAARRDDLWHSIVRAILDRRKTLEEESQRRLLEIAGDASAIGELAHAVMEPARTPDGSPLVATQAAAVLTAYRHLASVVSVMAPDQLADAMRNMAQATSTLDSGVATELLRAAAETPDPGGLELSQGLAAGFDDEKIAALLATTLATQGRAAERLAVVFSTIATDEERQVRVLTLTRSLLTQRLANQPDQFKAIWGSMEELVVQYNEQQYTSARYRGNLDGSLRRAETMAAKDLPPELDEWLQSVGQDNVRRLSVTLLVDLLRMEREEAQAISLVEEMGAIAEDLILSGDYEGALGVATILARQARVDKALAHDAAQTMLLDLTRSTAVKEAIALLDVMDERQYAAFRLLCPPLGAATIETLHKRLLTDTDGTARLRTIEIIASFGAEAIPWLAPLVADTGTTARRSLAELLGGLAVPEAVPLLEPLLTADDPRVLADAVRALGRIDDPSAGRAIHSALRTASGQQRRAIVEALVALRERRTVPMLVQILDDSNPFKEDYDVVLEALGVLQVVGDDRAVPAVNRLMRRRRWFATRKVRALKEATVATLLRLKSPRALAAVKDASTRGDRVLRALATAALETAEAS